MQEGRKEGRKEGWMDGWMNGWMDEIIYVDRKYCLVIVVSYVLTILHAPSYVCKALPGFFPLNFHLLYLSEETCFHQADPLPV